MTTSACSVSFCDVGAEELHTVHGDGNIITDDVFGHHCDALNAPENIAAEVRHSADELPEDPHSLCQEEKHTSLSPPPLLLSTPQDLSCEFAKIDNGYKKLFLQHGEELLQMRSVFCPQEEETENNTKLMPDLRATEAAKMIPRRQFEHEPIICEHEKETAEKEEKGLTDFMKTTPHRRPLSPADVLFVKQYDSLLQHHDRELEKAAVGYTLYAADLAKRFKRPPVIIPPHLMNNFADANVIEAKDHKGRMDVSPQSVVASHRKQARTEKGVVSSTTAAENRHEESDEMQQERRLFGSFPLEKDAVVEHQQQQQQPQPQPQPQQLHGPRFTIHSLSNGDLRERDALSGQAYWDCEAPTVRRRLLPSQLLDESERKAFYMYRMYSRRWGVLLRELATAIGGEEGAELLSRYETREESVPLQYCCRRDFYESVIDYDELLGEQERIMDKVERDLEKYYSSKVAPSKENQSPPSLPL